MDNNVKTSLLQTIQQQLAQRKDKKRISPELREALDACTTVDEVKELLFSLDFKDQATIKAFDKKLDDLNYTL